MPRIGRHMALAFALGLGLGLGLAIGRFGGPLLSARAMHAEPVAVSPSVSSDDAAYAQLTKQYEQFRSVDQTFELVSKLVAPAVVHIVSRKSGVRSDGSPGRFDETGSGVIVRSEGDDSACYVLTNHHVVAGSAPADVKIHLHDGAILKPDQFWTDEKVDVAVLRLPRGDLPTARLGNSDEVGVGHWVLALGSPFGLTHSVSQGIISARGRYEQELEADGVENQDFLQTDAAINPGNSGGPLVNLRGEVVGINTAIASNGGGSEGVGFSIPINLVKWALHQLIAQGKVSRGAIGVRLQQLTPQMASDLGLLSPRGARIESVQAGTPAATAGLQRGDVVLKYNDVEIVDDNHLINQVSTSQIGDSARLVIWRDRKVQDFVVSVADRSAIIAPLPKLTDRSTPSGFLRRPRSEGAPGRLVHGPLEGVDIAPIDSAEAARAQGLPATMRGLLIVRVDGTSPLATILETSDVLQAIDGRPVQTAEEVARAVADAGVHSLHVVRTRGGNTENRIVEIQVP